MLNISMQNTFYVLFFRFTGDSMYHFFCLHIFYVYVQYASKTPQQKIRNVQFHILCTPGSLYICTFSLDTQVFSWKPLANEQTTISHCWRVLVHNVYYTNTVHKKICGWLAKCWLSIKALIPLFHCGGPRSRRK